MILTAALVAALARIRYIPQVLAQTRLSPVGNVAVGSQNHIRRGAQRHVTVNCCRIPALRGFDQAVPSESFWKRDRGTARHTLFEATLWAIWSAVVSVRRILGSIHQSPMVRAETARANYAASRQEY